MIKRVELQHKVKYLGKEYSVILHNDSDFSTAFKTSFETFSSPNLSYGYLKKVEKASQLSIRWIISHNFLFKASQGYLEEIKEIIKENTNNRRLFT